MSSISASLGVALCAAGVSAAAQTSACTGTLYLTLDTGSMSQADLIAKTLNKHNIKATFFLANEKTIHGDYSLDASWAPYWKALASEGHMFGTHTFDHVYFRGESASDVINAKPQFGPKAGQNLVWTSAAMCSELNRVNTQFKSLTGQSLSKVWRAPGGKASSAAMQAAQACGYKHVHWAAAGFLGDELSSETFPNDKLLAKALATLKDGDIMMAHLGIWSRKDPWAPAVFDPLITALKQRGFCFATLAKHPLYQP
jgi:peptidoglycan/xylan/chitin deacetylase (PgdA/CDA1 family)